MKDYGTAERRSRAIEDALYGDPNAAAAAERAERVAGTVRIERGPAAFRVTFPMLATAERGTPAAKTAWDDARAPMADVKAIIGRRFDKMSAAWIVPLDAADSIACLAEEYAAQIEDVAPAAGLDTDAADRITELERKLSVVTAERDAAIRLADEYAAALELESVAA